MAIKIITDSTSYLSQEIIREYPIEVLSLNVILNDESRKEVELDNQQFYSEMKVAKEIPTSSQPSVGELYQRMEEIVAGGNAVVGIFLSSKMSGTYSTACMVREQILEKYPQGKIVMIDSCSNCMQMGFAVLEGGKAAYLGKSMDEVITQIQHVVRSSRFLFTPDTLEYLRKGGRIGGASALLGNLLQIKPILTVENGETTVFTKVRTKKKAIETIVNQLKEDLNGKTLGGIVVHHINCEEEGRALANQLANSLDVTVGVIPIGPVIGVHVGPGSIGVAYWWK